MGSEFILVVDDHPGIQSLLCEFLREFGYDSRLAGSGEEALRIIDREIPMLILLDIKMPGMGGIEALKVMKSRLPGVPVIVISACSENDVFSGTRQGEMIEYYIEKPFDLKKLLNMIIVVTGRLEMPVDSTMH